MQRPRRSGRIELKDGRDLVAAAPAFGGQCRCVDNVDVVGAVFAAKCPPDLSLAAAGRPDEKGDTRAALKVVVDDHGRGPAGCVLANDPADVGVQPSLNVFRRPVVDLAVGYGSLIVADAQFHTRSISFLCMSCGQKKTPCGNVCTVPLQSILLFKLYII